MKPNTKRIVLTRELHEVFIVRQGRRFQSFCGECQADSEFLSLDAAVQVSGVGTREILRRVEMLEVHAQETAGGLLLICLKSLAEK
jgi:hypothetical protein